MTENEYKHLRYLVFSQEPYDHKEEQAIIKIFEEIQRYRAIGTVEELKSMKENGAFTGVELAQLAAMQMRLKEYSAIGTIEEFKALKETNVEIEIPEPQGNEIVAGIMIPKVKGKAVVSLSDLHDILMDVGGTNIRDKVFEQIYNRDIIIGLRDVIEKWEERRKYESNRYR